MPLEASETQMIKTKRLIIRPLEKKDFKVWRESRLNGPEQKNVWDLTRRKPEECTWPFFKKLLQNQNRQRKDDKFYHFTVFERDSGQIVGGVSLMEVSRALSQSAYLGYGIYNSYWGRGYGKEAVSAVINHGFKKLKLHRIEAGIEPINRRSIMLARSLGLRKEGLKKRAIFLRNKWVDLVMYTATCEDFGIKWAGATNRPIR